MAVFECFAEALEANDVGVPGRVAQQCVTVASDQDRELFLHRPVDVGSGELMVGAVPVDRLAVEKAPQDLYPLEERCFAPSSRKQLYAGFAVLVRGVAGTEAEFKTTVRQMVERRCFPRELHRVAHVGVEHERADPQGRRGRCDGR